MGRNKSRSITTIVLICLIAVGFSQSYFSLFMTAYMGIPEQRAEVLLKEMKLMSDKYPMFNVIDYITIMGIETGGKNIYGDYGKAIGYFQLHKDAIFYVWEYYPEYGRFKFKNTDIKKLLLFPKLQVDIAASYLYLLYLKYNSKEKAIAAYNGDINGTNHYYEKFKQYQKFIFKYLIQG